MFTLDPIYSVAVLLINKVYQLISTIAGLVRTTIL